MRAECCRVSLIILLCSNISAVYSMRLRKVEIPSHAVRGENVPLVCEYDLEGDSLYSLKWYKNGKEFFRFVPDNSPQLQFLNIRGINIDEALTTKNRVVLKSIDLSGTGRYHCEVSAEGPSFKSDIHKGDMVVVDLPENQPSISGMKRAYSPGDLLHINCTSSPSKPAASLQWYVNGHLAHGAIEYVPMIDRDGLETSKLGLKFEVGKRHFEKYGELKLKCTASIARLYYGTTNFTARRAATPPFQQKSRFHPDTHWFTGISRVAGFCSCSHWILILLFWLSIW